MLRRPGQKIVHLRYALTKHSCEVASCREGCLDDTEDETDRLIGLVYEAVVDAGAWQVDAIDIHLDGADVRMHAHDQLAKQSGR